MLGPPEQVDNLAAGLEIVEQKPHPLQIVERPQILQEVSLAADDQLALVALAPGPARQPGGNDFLCQFVELGLALLEPPLDLEPHFGERATANARIEEVRCLDSLRA